ncbi:MAG: hypothetical protein ACPL7B_16600 [Candidatus Poribacteria bacterium]
MPFDWREYIELAKSLQSNRGNGYSQEASLRSAISRSYYGAFCYVRNFIRDYKGYSPLNNASDHFHVREHFKKYGQIDIARKLEKLRQWRNNCDYDDTVNDLSILFKEAIQYAQEVIDKLK